MSSNVCMFVSGSKLKWLFKGSLKILCCFIADLNSDMLGIILMFFSSLKQSIFNLVALHIQYLVRGQSRFGESIHSNVGPPPLRFTHLEKKLSLQVISSMICLHMRPRKVQVGNAVSLVDISDRLHLSVIWKVVLQLASPSTNRAPQQLRVSIVATLKYHQQLKESGKQFGNGSTHACKAWKVQVAIERMMRETVYRMMQIDDWNNDTSYSKCTVQRRKMLSCIF